MIRAILAMILIPLYGCGHAGQVPVTSAHAGVVPPPPIASAIKQDHSAPKRESPTAAEPSDPASAVLSAIGQAKDTVERRSYILDDRAYREMP
jgi:hypothetical protein